MKKTLSVILSICIFISLFSFTGCTSKKSKYIQAKQKLGMIDENGKEVRDSVAGELEEISEAINILNDLGDYEDSVELESKASDYYYGDLAYKALNDYDFDKAEEYFKKTKVNLPDRFLMVIPNLKKVVGTWKGTYGSGNTVTVTISGPFVPVIPEYTNCDWGISVNVTIVVSKSGTYPSQYFSIVQKSAYYYLNDTDKLSYKLRVKNDNYGEFALSYNNRYGYGKSEISLFPSPEKERELCLFEDICDNNFSTVYATGFLDLKKLS